jgi:hypothetical protein
MALTKQHTKTIDGITYTTTTLPAAAGLVILPKMMSLFGEALIGLFIATDDDTRESLLEDPKVLAAMLTRVSEKAAEDDGLLVLKDLLVSTEADRVSIGDAEVPGSVHTHFDGHFAGRYRHLFEVALFVGVSNFIAP